MLVPVQLPFCGSYGATTLVHLAVETAFARSDAPVLV